MALDLSKFTINSSGDIRQVSAFVPGTNARYTTLELHAALRARLSGYLVPKLVREIAGDTGKRPL